MRPSKVIVCFEGQERPRGPEQCVQLDPEHVNPVWRGVHISRSEHRQGEEGAWESGMAGRAGLHRGDKMYKYMEVNGIRVSHFWGRD